MLSNINLHPPYSEGDDGPGPRVCGIEGHPGFYFVCGALTVEEQRAWLEAAAKELAEPPARTNHTATLGLFRGLWAAAERGDHLTGTTVDGERNVRGGESAACSGVDAKGDVAEAGCAAYAASIGAGVHAGERSWTPPPPGMKRGDGGERYAAAHLFSKLRWATLGPQFDWTKRVYDDDIPARPIPAELCLIAQRVAAAAGVPPSRFTGDAGLVNYYQEGDTLNGHVDDAEHDLTKPIVSMSLGCPGVFLLGQRTRDGAPTALLMRSGDAMVLSGESRYCYHGVPRVFTLGEGALDAAGEPLAPPPELFPAGWKSPIAEWVARTRVNISIRDIY